MSIQKFEDNLILDESIPVNCKLLINEMKNKVMELSRYLGYEDSTWIHDEFIEEYFDSISSIMKDGSLPRG